jgi:hypothetical protein
VSSALRRFAAHLALFAFAGVLCLSALDGHSGFDDDRACGERGLHVTRYASELQAPVPVAPAQHCPLCHLQRAASGASPVIPAAVAGPLTSPVATHVECASHPRQGTPASRSSRAPPSLDLAFL